MNKKIIKKQIKYYNKKINKVLIILKMNLIAKYKRMKKIISKKIKKNIL